MDHIWPECFFETEDELVCLFFLPPGGSVPSVDHYSVAGMVRDGRLEVTITAGMLAISADVIHGFLKGKEGGEKRVVLVAKPFGAKRAELVGVIPVNRDFAIEYRSIQKLLKELEDMELPDQSS